MMPAEMEHGKLFVLLTEVRALQAILSLYKFFQGRMHLIEYEFKHHNLPLLPLATFELLSEKFMNLLEEPYLSKERIMLQAKSFGLTKNDAMQLIIFFSQYRDAVDAVSPNLYRSLDHKKDVKRAIIDTLEELEEQVDD